MKRRGNKSSKVPNVKLRPADKGAYSHPIVESCWAQDTQAPEDSSTILDTCPRPLTDVVICATGITDKPTLFKQAVELGATCTLAFTDRVTHLIAVDHGGAKYMCALERKIPIVKPSWITDNFQIWLKGDDVDVEQSLSAHRLPIFSDVIVCPSGITDITRRTQISKLIAAHDGAYLKNLERPVRVTHLLCSGDEETDKMRYAEKFNARGEAKIHLVWEEWFWDSLDFGGRFDEGAYEVRRPRPERKQLQQPAGPPPSSSLPSRFDEAPSSSAPPRHAPPQNQNAAAAADNELEEEPAFAKVLPDVTLQLWGQLLGRRGYQVTDGEIILSPSKADPNDSNRKRLPPPSPAQEHELERPAFGAARSVISSFRRANSFAPQETSTARQVLPFRRTATTGAVFANANAVAGPSRLPADRQAPAPPAAMHQRSSSSKAAQPPPNAPKSKTPESDPPAEAQIFAGLRIRLMGEAKGGPVRGAIELRGGVVAAGDEGDDGHQDVDFIVVRLVSGSKLYLLEEDPRVRAKFRTECWLEQCIYEDRVCLPSEHLAFVPLGIPTPVPRAEQVFFSFSGFEQSAGHALKRLLRALGITLAPTFNKRATHLLCPSGTGLKFDKAMEWGVPVVSMGWLEEMATTGSVPPVERFLVLRPPGDVGMSESVVEDTSGVPPNPPVRHHKDLDPKGKGKAVERMETGNGRALPVGGDAARAGGFAKDGIGKRIVDITNDVQAGVEQPAAKKQKQKSLQSLGREPTTIIPNGPQQEGGSRALVRNRTGSTFSNSGYFVHPSSIPTQSRLPSMPPNGFGNDDGDTPETGTPNHDMFLPDRSFSLHNLQHQQSMPYSNPQIEAEKSNPNFRIPSSKSPSPMKLRISNAGVGAVPAVVAEPGAAPAQQRQMRRTNSRGMSLSPVKIDHEAARALQESITSLLGKRPSTDTEDAAVPGGAGNGTKGTKRARPQRNKAQSRQVSDASIDVNAPTGVGDAKGKGVANGKHPAEYASAISAFESYEEHGHGHGGGRSSVHVEQESMRVMYEDPGQRLEKQRLMDLLKSQNPEEDSISSGSSSFNRKSTRRSARIAG